MSATISKLILKLVGSIVILMLLMLGVVSTRSATAGPPASAVQRDEPSTPLHTALTIDQFPATG